LLEVYYLCLLLGFKGRYAAGGDLRSIMATVQEKIRRVRGPSAALSPRGAIPADAVRLVQSDPWVRRLAITALVTSLLAIALFLVFKFSLISGASELSTQAAQFVK
jgi:type VI secretion system protein ImpK